MENVAFVRNCLPTMVFLFAFLACTGDLRLLELTGFTDSGFRWKCHSSRIGEEADNGNSEELAVGLPPLGQPTALSTSIDPFDFVRDVEGCGLTSGKATKTSPSSLDC
jgi:hypothetical protein